ncbi:hypothetical protein HUU05_23025 [candidate division KSB1 bacterium]|nr:hypothetical protein [candidate division KSB1 bacterium]
MNTVRFALPEPSPVRLAIYNQMGNEIRLLVSGSLPAGEHLAQWDGRDDSGRLADCGVYFYRLDSPSFHEVRKLLRH